MMQGKQVLGPLFLLHVVGIAVMLGRSSGASTPTINMISSSGGAAIPETIVVNHFYVRDDNDRAIPFHGRFEMPLVDFLAAVNRNEIRDVPRIRNVSDYGGADFETRQGHVMRALAQATLNHILYQTKVMRLEGRPVSMVGSAPVLQGTEEMPAPVASVLVRVDLHRMARALGLDESKAAFGLPDPTVLDAIRDSTRMWAYTTDVLSGSNDKTLAGLIRNIIGEDEGVSVDGVPATVWTLSDNQQSAVDMPVFALTSFGFTCENNVSAGPFALWGPHLRAQISPEWKRTGLLPNGKADLFHSDPEFTKLSEQQTYQTGISQSGAIALAAGLPASVDGVVITKLFPV